MKKISFIINPISGTKKKKRIPTLIDTILKGTDISYEIVSTEYAGHATEITKQKVMEGVDVVVAIGGDGTVNEVASALVHTNTALGIVPCGSGNGLARHLGIPMKAERAIEVFLDGVIQQMDYGIINDKQLFFCSCGVGFDALVSWKFAHANRRGLMTYCGIALKENFRYKPETYTLKTDTGEELVDRAFVIACGNATQYGNDAFITPHASAADGKLDITLIEPINVLDAATLAYQLFAKKIDRNRKVRTLRCNKLSLMRTHEGAMHFDGEPVMAPKRVDIEIVRLGLNVFTPKEQLI